MSPLTLFFVATVARADDIVFSELSVSADAGITLSYTLSPATADAVAQGARMGQVPRISVQVAAGGMDKTTHVELTEPSRTVEIASGSWPPGLTATVKLEQGVRDLDRLRTPQGSGTRLSVKVAGGTTGAQPLGMPAQPSTDRTTRTTQVQVEPGSPEPVAVDPAALLAAAQAAAAAAAQAQATAEQQRLWAEEQQRIAEERARVQAYLRGIFDDPAHPVHAACASGLAGGQFEDCVNVAAFRDDGAAEVGACMRLSEPGFRDQCVESLAERRYAAADAIGACVDVFGTGDGGLRCGNAVLEAADDPAGDVRACGAGFASVDERMGCIGRLREAPGDAGALVQACSAAFSGERATECVAIGASARGVSETVTACADGFADDKLAIECLIVLRPAAERGAPLVPVCAGLFSADKERLQCLERGRRDPDPVRIAACGTAEAKRRLRCVEGG